MNRIRSFALPPFIGCVIASAASDGVMAFVYANIAVLLFVVYSVADHKLTLDKGIEIGKEVGARHPDLYAPNGKLAKRQAEVQS
jgi:hypothetical protein